MTRNQIKSRKRAASRIEEKAMTRMLWLLWKVNHKLGCASQDSGALASQGTQEFRRNPMQKVWNSIQRVRFTKSTLRHASIREKKGPPLGKINVKNPHQRSPYAVKFEDRSFEETARQQRCARCKAWNLAKNIQTPRKRQEYVPLAGGRMSPPGCGNKSAGGKRVCGWFRSEYAYEQYRKTLTLLSWRPWGHQGVRRR